MKRSVWIRTGDWHSLFGQGVCLCEHMFSALPVYFWAVLTLMCASVCPYVKVIIERHSIGFWLCLPKHLLDVFCGFGCSSKKYPDNVFVFIWTWRLKIHIGGIFFEHHNLHNMQRLVIKTRCYCIMGNKQLHIFGAWHINSTKRLKFACLKVAKSQVLI